MGNSGKCRLKHDYIDVGCHKHLHRTNAQFSLSLKTVLMELAVIVLFSPIRSIVSPSIITEASAFNNLTPKRSSNFFKNSNQHSSSTTLHIFRPDWLRRAGRIEKKRKEKNEFYNSFRNRQRELGLIGYEDDKKRRKIFSNEPGAPRRYRVKNDDNENLLKVYMFIPRDDYEANDESNVIERLKDGEIVTSCRSAEGVWIEHDRGGWSPTVLDGILRLVPLDDDND